MLGGRKPYGKPHLNPWHAPGTAPIASPCGTFGGNPQGCRGGPPTEKCVQIHYPNLVYATIQMRYFMKLYVKGHQSYNKSNSKVQKKTYFIRVPP